MYKIIGGTYFEYCAFPEWSQLYGSGMRATIALSNLLPKIELNTCLTDVSLNIAKIYSRQFDFNLKSSKRNNDITFSYLTPLHSPYVSGIPKRKKFKSMYGENILQFGMLEFNCKINAQKVVYDPQSPNEPTYFDSNGSEAKEIIYVLNYSEGERLTGEKKIGLIAKKILRKRNVVGVVIKNDARGAFAFTKKSEKYFAPFETKSVWTIGSGDIFSSVLFYYWTKEKLELFQAVEKASYFTAFYAENKYLPLDDFKLIRNNFLTKKLIANYKNKNNLVYLAGSFFDIQHLQLITTIKEILIKKNINVFSPYHDIGRGGPDIVVQKDLKALTGAKLLFAVLDDLDAGTIFEIGYARALKIPVIILIQNKRANDLTMMIGTECEIYDDFTTAIYKVVWKMLFK